MEHLPCECSEATSSCPRYGWMKGHKYKVCKGQEISSIERNNLLDIWSGKKLTIIQKAVNFVGAAFKHVIAGMPVVSDDTYEKRKSICETCEFCDKQKERWECVKCGCALLDGGPLAPAKLRWAEHECPLPEKKWKAELPSVKNPGRCGGCGS